MLSKRICGEERGIFHLQQIRNIDRRPIQAVFFQTNFLRIIYENGLLFSDRKTEIPICFIRISILS